MLKKILLVAACLVLTVAALRAEEADDPSKAFLRAFTNGLEEIGSFHSQFGGSQDPQKPPQDPKVTPPPPAPKPDSEADDEEDEDDDGSQAVPKGDIGDVPQKDGQPIYLDSRIDYYTMGVSVISKKGFVPRNIPQKAFHVSECDKNGSNCEEQKIESIKFVKDGDQRIIFLVEWRRLFNSIGYSHRQELFNLFYRLSIQNAMFGAVNGMSDKDRISIIAHADWRMRDCKKEQDGAPRTCPIKMAKVRRDFEKDIAKEQKACDKQRDPAAREKCSKEISDEKDQFEKDIAQDALECPQKTLDRCVNEVASRWNEYLRLKNGSKQEAVGAVQRMNFYYDIKGENRDASFANILIEVLERLKDFPGRKTIVVVGSGVNTFLPGQGTQDELERAVKNGHAIIHTVDAIFPILSRTDGAMSPVMTVQNELGSSDFRQGENLLRYIAQWTGGQHFTMRDIEGRDAKSWLNELMAKTRQMYMISYKPTHLHLDGKQYVLKIQVTGDDGKPLQVVDYDDMLEQKQKRKKNIKPKMLDLEIYAPTRRQNPTPIVVPESSEPNNAPSTN